MKLTAGTLGSGVAVGLAATVAFGTAVAYAAPYTRQAVLVVSDPNPFPNQIDGVQGLDYHPTELVALDGHSAPIHFGDFMTDAAGHFATTIRIPEEWRCSRHTLIGTGASGAPDDIASAVLNVRGCPGEEDHRHHHPMPGGGFFVDDEEDDDVAGGPHHDALPGTGGQVVGIALSGAGLIAAGLALTAHRRRRGRAG